MLIQLMLVVRKIKLKWFERYKLWSNPLLQFYNHLKLNISFLLVMTYDYPQYMDV